MVHYVPHTLDIALVSLQSMHTIHLVSTLFLSHALQQHTLALDSVQSPALVLNAHTDLLKALALDAVFMMLTPALPAPIMMSIIPSCWHHALLLPCVNPSKLERVTAA
jgi:hypothetical protein